jgi:hypothetical protein
VTRDNDRRGETWNRLAAQARQSGPKASPRKVRMTSPIETNNVVERLREALRDFPADGQLRALDRDTMTDLILAGFIERIEVEKPCKTCGKPKFDYGYFRITGGGKLFMEAVSLTRRAETRSRLGPQGWQSVIAQTLPQLSYY